MKSAAALIIGNELLSGKISDQNLVVLARALRELGIDLTRVVMVQDRVDVIADEVRLLSREHDWLFTSGGIGPTHDDVTVEGVAKAFGVRVTVAAKMEAMLRAHYGTRIREGHLLMARIPEGARLVSNRAVPWPTVVCQNVWLFPGIPEVFAMKIPLLYDELRADAPFVSLSVMTTLEEGELKPLLDRVVADFGEVEIGSYPKWNDPGYKTKLTFDGRALERVREARDAFVHSLPAESIVGVE